MIRLNLSYTNNSFVCIVIQTFQLTHIFSHLMNEGIGLRQLVDYYYVICDFYKVYQNSSNHPINFSKITPSLFTLKEGSTSHPDPLSSGAREETALLGARNRYALRLADHQRSTPDCAGWDRLGMVQEELKKLELWKFAGGIMYIMQEVFCMPASRLIVPPNEKCGKFVLNEVLEAGNFGKHDARNRFGRSQFGHNLQRVYRDMRLVRYFPAEALSEPIFRTWHFFWRLKHRR